MSKKRIVIALGGNALGKNLPAQYLAVQETSRAIADLAEDGNEVIISHGNGPQVGMIHNAMAAYSRTDPSHPALTPLSVCVATIITQVRVDENDPAFQNPTKPIGHFMTKEEAAEAEKNGLKVVEDSGRGYRRVVASPKPAEIVELDTVKDLLNAGEIVIASGGGGIPVIRQGNHLKGVGAVIDKDFASCLLAQELNADFLIILTAVEKAALHFGTPQETWLDELTAAQAEKYAAEGHFAPGSMLPKIQAGIAFASSAPERTALITLLEKAKDGVNGKTGTRIVG